VPEAAAVTVTDTVQLAPEASVNPVSLTSVLPAAGAAYAPAPVRPCQVEPVQVLVTVPLNTVIAPGLVGSTSVKLIPDTLVTFEAGFGLVMVKVSVVLPPLAIVAAPNALLIVGGAYTLMDAVAAVPLGAFALVTAPVLLVLVPAFAPSTCTVYVQVVDAGTVPPVKARLGPLLAAVSVPVHPAPLIAAPGVPLLVIGVGPVG
jgi:hypothetical protein